MSEITFALASASFIAGILMFLAPCTLPLVPAYLAFIAGLKSETAVLQKYKLKIITNSIFFTIGFSTVFISLGILTGFAGIFTGSLRQVLVPIAGILVLAFGFQMLHVINLERLFTANSFAFPKYFTPGTKSSAFTIGVAFALGWTPCIGPLLATILLLSGTIGTVASGAILLTIFSLGFAVPFIVTAWLYGTASTFIQSCHRLTWWTERIGGLFLILIGGLLLTGNFDLTVTYGYKILSALGIGDLLDYY